MKDNIKTTTVRNQRNPSNDPTSQNKKDNEEYGQTKASFDNPAYRPFDSLPYTDFTSPEDRDTPIFTGNHLIHPKKVTDSHLVFRNAGTSKFNSYNKSNGYSVNFNGRRKKSARNPYYHDNYSSYKNGTVQNYIGRRMGPHHKYATTRHSPILAYNGSRLGLANGEIRKSQSLGRSSAHLLHHSAPAVLIPTPVVYSHAPFFQTPITNVGIDNPMILQPNRVPNGIPPSPRHHRHSDGERGDSDSENESRRESQGTSERNSRSGAVINFLRHPKNGRLTNKKETCVSFFDIETDKVSSYIYRPGEEVSGVVTLIIQNTVEIRFVELVVTGRGHIVFRQPEGKAGSMSGKLGRSTKETYLYKRTHLIGSGDDAWSSLLTPGTYSSKFRVKLPEGLPSSLRHDDVTNGMSMDISYSLKVRICDDPGPSASVRSRTSTRSQGNRQIVRIVMAKQINFNVQRSFDLSMVPGAAAPFSHTEQLFMSCAHTEAAVVTVNLDRSVFLAGDDVKLLLTTSLPSGQRIKEIVCSLQEHVTLDPRREPIIILLTRMLRKDPGQLTGRPTDQEPSGAQEALEVTIPTQTDLVSPFSLGSSKTRIEYFLEISLKFSRSGGKLAFKVPLTIGPCAEPIYAEKTSSRKIVPVFNRPTRFPYFTSPTTAQPQPTRSQSARIIVSQESLNTSKNVQSKYSNNCLSRLFLCCASTTG
ncbi:hypothetical protein RRG08_018215 [Elysia crispata]|uniref:Arrestin C-terminal-like domain-containing protein n=1 Tax=Elysia crispata TaxID=231223 RepID=A0AAE0YKG4_9GAST|nr:hypothetical protein RRG08_018215 [Elysia crispata]